MCRSGRLCISQCYKRRHGPHRQGRYDSHARMAANTVDICSLGTRRCVLTTRRMLCVLGSWLDVRSPGPPLPRWVSPGPPNVSLARSSNSGLTRCPFTGLARSSHAASRWVLPRWAVLCHGLAGSSLRPRWVLPIPGPLRILSLWVLLWPPPPWWLLLDPPTLGLTGPSHAGPSPHPDPAGSSHTRAPRVPFTGSLWVLPCCVSPGPCTLAGTGGSQSLLYKDLNSS